MMLNKILPAVLITLLISSCSGGSDDDPETAQIDTDKDTIIDSSDNSLMLRIPIS